MMNPCLSIEGLMKNFGRLAALDGIDLELAQGSTLALLGPNGAGKSTLFSCLLGFALPDAGRIAWHGGDLEAADRSRFGYVSERVSLYQNRTVLENASFFAELKNCGTAEVQRQLERLRLASVAGRKIRQLSKGMLQRLGLAIALLGAPELIVLDEPFNGLDPVLLDEFIAVIREEQDRGAAFMIATHTISAVESLASDVAILLNGRLVFFGSVEEAGLPGGRRTLEALYQEVARQELREVAA